MGLADAVLGHEQTASREPKAGARTPFDGVNDLDPVAVADALGIERDGRKVKCCPGCGASSGCDIMDRGIVCQHDTCARLGNGKVVNGSTFYSNVDSIMVARRCTVREAIGWASERFGTAKWINREPTTHAPKGAPSVPATVTPRKSPAERARGLGERLVRVPSGIEAIDAATRGGPATRKRLFVVGAPGAGKTGFVCQYGVRSLLAGVHVAIIAADESADDLLIRIGQQLGYDRAILESPDHPLHAETKEAFAAQLDGLRLTIVDGDEDADPFIETVARELAERANGAPSMLIVDSIQRVRALAAEEADNPRMRADGVVAALKYASGLGCLVVATSEANRGFYANRAFKSEGLAAGKESSSIEYAATVLITLESVKGESDLVDAQIVKNRMGKRGDCFRLRWDFSRAQFEEVETDPDDKPVDPRQARIEAASRRILNYVRKHPGESKRNAIFGTSGKTAEKNEAFDALLDAGSIRVEERTGRGGGWVVFPVMVDVHVDGGSEDDE
jgi:KaiC/GvpD/RAD55 family RecA-like ATPase